MNLLEVRDLVVDFRIDEATSVRAVKGVSFDVPVRSTVALVGESGSGKSVSALSIMGLLPRENATVGAVPPVWQLLHVLAAVWPLYPLTPAA